MLLNKRRTSRFWSPVMSTARRRAGLESGAAPANAPRANAAPGSTYRERPTSADSHLIVLGLAGCDKQLVYSCQHGFESGATLANAPRASAAPGNTSSNLIFERSFPSRGNPRRSSTAGAEGNGLNLISHNQAGGAGAGARTPRN